MNTRELIRQPGKLPSLNRDVLYCEAAHSPWPEIAGVVGSIDLDVEFARLNDMVSTCSPAVLEHEIVLIPIYGSRVPDAVYKLCRQIRSTACPLWRMEPTILLIVFQALPVSVDADLRYLGCDLIFAPNAAQLISRLRSEEAYRTRAKRQGVLIERITPFDWKLIGPLGSESFYLRNRRERRLFTKLMSDRRIFDITELALATGCDEEQIKVLIKRIRELYGETRTPLGICIPPTMFIETIEEAHGYRLFATVRDRPRQ